MNRAIFRLISWSGAARLGAAIALLAFGGCDSATATTMAADAGATNDAAADGQGAKLDTSGSQDATATTDNDAAATPFVPGDPPAGMLALGYGQTGDLAVEVFAPVALTMGQNYLAYRVTAQGVVTSAATIIQAGQMDMGGTPHGCPFIDPPESADDQGLFQGIAVFQMASAEGDLWRLNLNVAAPLGATARTLTISDMTVTKSTWATSMTAPDGSKYIVSLYFPKKPKVGLNPYTLTVHGNPADSDTFPAVADATVKATPLMITMGHGSSGNIAPLPKGGGLYAGKANFSMPGEWKLTFAVSAGGASLGSASFKITL